MTCELKHFLNWLLAKKMINVYLLLMILVGCDSKLNYQFKTEDKIKSIYTAVKVYVCHCEKVPNEVGELIEDKGGCPLWRGPYIDDVSMDEWGNPMIISFNRGHGSIQIRSKGGDGILDTNDDLILSGKITISDIEKVKSYDWCMSLNKPKKGQPTGLPPYSRTSD